MKKVEVFVKNIFLHILLILKGSKKKQGEVKFDKNSKILFIRLNRIGDALVTTPLIKKVRDEIGCKIFILADKHNSFIFRSNHLSDEVIVFEKGFAGFRKVLSRIRHEKFDAVVDLHDDVSTTVTYIIALCNAPNKFGLKKSNSAVYTKTVDRPDAVTTHVVDRIMELGKLLNLNNHSRSGINIAYRPSPKALENAAKYLLRRMPQKKFFVGINISAGSAARFWGIDNYKQVVAFLGKYDVNLLVMCTTRDINAAMDITNNMKDQVFYTPSFDEFAAMISNLDLLFTPDTSIVHLASAFCKPVFGLYVKYNTTDMVWSPYRSDFECIVTTDYSLANVTAEETITKFKPFLEKHLNEYRNTKM